MNKNEQVISCSARAVTGVLNSDQLNLFTILLSTDEGVNSFLDELRLRNESRLENMVQLENQTQSTLTEGSDSRLKDCLVDSQGDVSYE